MSRMLKMSKISVLRKLIFIEQQTEKPDIVETDYEYEIDEMRTYIGNTENECWIMYALNKATGRVIDFVVGRRTKENIKKVVDTVLRLNPKRIFTDGWNVYPGLIPKEKHIKSAHRINHIERRNLNLRTHLKCLNRETICYSKSEEMLAIKVQIYFFGQRGSLNT